MQSTLFSFVIFFWCSVDNVYQSSSSGLRVLYKKLFLLFGGGEEFTAGAVSEDEHHDSSTCSGIHGSISFSKGVPGKCNLVLRLSKKPHDNVL
jgi:hypothetical protein